MKAPSTQIMLPFSVLLTLAFSTNNLAEPSMVYGRGLRYGGIFGGRGVVIGGSSKVDGEGGFIRGGVGIVVGGNSTISDGTVVSGGTNVTGTVVGGGTNITTNGSVVIGDEGSISDGGFVLYVRN